MRCGSSYGRGTLLLRFIESFLFQMVERSSRVKIRDSERITVDLEQPFIDMLQHKQETLTYKINRAALSLSVSSHDTAH